MKSNAEDRIATLKLEEIIARTMMACRPDIEPLMEYLKMEKMAINADVEDQSKKIARYFREMGSNDLATALRGAEPVEYDEIVYDVGAKLKAKVKYGDSAFENEKKIIEKVFADTLDKMSVEEKKELFESMGITATDIPWKKAGLELTQLLLRKYGGFAIYKMTLIVTNAIAKFIFKRGLSLATNAMLMRGLSIFTGPIGWSFTGLWLLIDIAGPAYRKTVPSVIYTAALRQMLLYRINIGVVGDGSTGKDSMLKSVFNIDTGRISPVAGSTSSMEIYPLGKSGAYLSNFPGFNDYRQDVNQELDDYINHMDVFILIVDISRGVSQTDINIFNKVNSFGKPIAICLNKIDMPRNQREKEELIKTAKIKIKADRFIETAFDPDDRIPNNGPIGIKEVYEWVCEKIEQDGKDSSSIREEER